MLTPQQIVTFHHFNWKWHLQIQFKVVFNCNLPLDEFHPLTNHDIIKQLKLAIHIICLKKYIQMMKIDLSMTQVELIIEKNIWQ